MEATWGLELWDRLDDIINHSNVNSNLVDKCYKCFNECHSIWIKSATKQKRLLEKLQQEFHDPYLKEFTFSMSLLNVINNFIAIYNVTNTFAQSSTKVTKDYLKKSHSDIKKQTQDWIVEKKKMEDELYKERKYYDASLKRYREKQQQLISANENYKKTDETKTMSRSQVDLSVNTLNIRRNEYDQSKIEYAVKLRDFNSLQQNHFNNKIPNWSKKGEKLHKDRIELIGKFGTDMAFLTSDMVNKLNLSVKQFSDIKDSIVFSKDQKILIQRFKTGDVPPSELKFIDLDMTMADHMRIITSSTSSQNESSLDGRVGSKAPVAKMQRTSMSSFGLSAQYSEDDNNRENDDDSDEFSDEYDEDEFLTSSSGNSVNRTTAMVKESQPEPHIMKGNTAHTNTTAPNEPSSNYVVRNSSNNSNNSFNNPRSRPIFNRRQDATDTSNSSFNLSSNHQETRSDIGISTKPRQTVNAVKMKSVGNRILNPESRLSIHKSNKIFNSSQPWMNNPQSTGASVAQTKIFQKRPPNGRRESSRNQSHRRSRSVTDLISTLVRSSLRIKNSRNTQDNNQYSQGSNYKRNSSVNNNDYCDYDDWENHSRPEIVNTPAEAVAMSKNVRKLSAPEMEHALQYYQQHNSSPTSRHVDNLTVRPPSPDYDNLSSIANDSQVHQYQQHQLETDLDDPVSYIGSCVAEFDFDGTNFSDGNYLTFHEGDQFYIIETDSPSKGWLLVDKINSTSHGFIPTSYVNLRLFDESDFSDSRKLTNENEDII